MFNKNFYKLIILFTVIIFDISIGNAQEFIPNVAGALEVDLTEEEKTWISQHPVIKATSKISTAPIEFIRAGESVGFSVDYLNLVAKNVGLEIKYIHTNGWAESLKKLENKEIDISHNIFRNSARENFLNFTDPYVKLKPAFFAKKGTAKIDNVEILRGKKIGVVKGWALNDAYKTKYPELIFIEFGTSLEAFVSLSKGEIDTYIATFFISDFLLKKNFISNVEFVGDTDFLDIANNEGTRIAVRNDWPRLYEILKKGMAVITEEQFTALNKKWLMPLNVSNSIGLTAKEIKWLKDNPVIKVAVDPYILPIESIDADGQISGISGSFIKIVAEKLNVDFEWIKNETFDDGLKKILLKEADMFSAVIPTAEREKFLIFSEGYMEISIVIFAREGGSFFGDVEGLSGHSVAMTKGFAVTDWLREQYPDIEIIEADTKVEAIRLVSSGIADAHIGNVATTSHNMAMAGVTNLVVSGETSYKGDVTMGVRSELPLLASAIQKAMASISDADKIKINRDWIVLKTVNISNTGMVWNMLAGAALILILILIWNVSLRQEVARRKFSEERFRQIAETVDGLFFISSPKLLSIKYMSPNLEKWTNIKCEEIYKNWKLWLDVVHPDDRELFKTSAKNIVKNNFTTNIPDYRFIDRNNNVRWLSTQAHAIKNERGEIVNIVGFVTDITSSVNSRAKLSEISKQFQNAFNHASHGMALVALDGKFLKVNEALSLVLGYTSDELLTLEVNQITHPDDKEMSELLMKEVYYGKRISFQLDKRYVTKDGRLVPIQLNVSMVRDDSGKPAHFVAQIQDLSELKEREEQLRQSQKMDAVGKLTGGIAHDFNNILGIILGNLEILKSTMPAEPKSEARLEKAINGVDRGTHLIKKLLSFSRKVPQTSDVVNINDSIRNLSDFIKRSLTVSIQVKMTLTENIWPVEIDGGDLEDAIVNLALNARDAMQGEGKLEIITENVSLDKSYAQLNPGTKPGDYVVLTIIDNGVGIPPELLDKVLEPFFTTKPVNKGTGLGLSMVHGFVQRSNGHLKILSNVGVGTEFKIYIPRLRTGRKKTSKGVLNINNAPVGHETILIVEDEKHLRDVAEVQLNELGYSVYTASNASFALEILSRKSDVDLLFSDIIMPDHLNGYEMATSALKIDPSLKILLTSGFTQNLEDKINAEDEILSSLSKRVLQKPYNKHQLATAVRKVLDV